MLETGRTKPLVCDCEYLDGRSAGAYVIKLRGEVNAGPHGLACEWMGAAFARRMGLYTPSAAIVRLEPDLVDAIRFQSPELAKRLEHSLGLNFGSRLELEAKNWAAGFRLLPGMVETAGAIFALDAILDNADRRIEKPNLLTRGEELIVIDHESAFGFLMGGISTWLPWEVTRMGYLQQHVLRAAIRRTGIQGRDLRERVGAITREWAEGLVANVPQEWKNERLQKVVEHVGAIEENANEFCRQVCLELT